MNYPPANLWTMVQIDPKPELEPELVNVCRVPALSLPASWTQERRSVFLFRWVHNIDTPE